MIHNTWEISVPVSWTNVSRRNRNSETFEFVQTFINESFSSKQVKSFKKSFSAPLSLHWHYIREGFQTNKSVRFWTNNTCTSSLAPFVKVVALAFEMAEPLTNEGMKNLIEKINMCAKLIAKTGQDPIEFNLPKIVVIGPQSAGKTSVLEVHFNWRSFIQDLLIKSNLALTFSSWVIDKHVIFCALPQQ